MSFVVCFATVWTLGIAFWTSLLVFSSCLIHINKNKRRLMSEIEEID